MARKKKEKKPKRTAMGWDAEDKDEALAAKGLKRVDLDEGRVTLVDRDTSTPLIETYDAETGELEGSILLKDGNREGLVVQVKIVEEVKVEQEHDANITSIGFNGSLDVVNPSKVDRLWDIDILLKNIDATNLKSSEIKILELGTTEDDNVDSREFQIKGEAKNLLLVKEYINCLPNADDILNISDIESDLINLKGKTAAAEELPDEPEPEPDEEEEEVDGDGGSAAAEYSLESYGISIDKENTVTFAIAMQSLFEKSITNVKVVKEIPEDFRNPTIRDSSVGMADLEGNQIVWNIEVLEPETTVVLKFTCDIMVSDIETRKTGTIEVTYQAASSFAEGLAIDKFDAYTRNRFYVDIIERDEEPGVWDCKLVFANTSEFIMQLFNADVYAPEDESTKLVDIDPEDVPLLPSEAEWHSVKWKYESDDYPSFRKKLEFRVMPDFITTVNGAISISDVELSIASMTGEVLYSLAEKPTDKEIEEKLVEVSTYKEQDVIATLKMENNGSAPLNEITFIHQYFTEEFNPPNADEIKIILDGSDVELSPEAVSVEGNVLTIALRDLKDSSAGMYEPESTIELNYPIHCVNPVQDARFESEITFLANTFPLSTELEVTPEVPAIEAKHIRRKFRVGKEVMPIGSLGEYQIILTVENIGDMPLANLSLMDKVPDKFEYSNVSMEPEITDEVGFDALKWTFETLDEGEKVEITYDITGKGKYKPSDAQLAL